MMVRYRLKLTDGKYFQLLLFISTIQGHDSGCLTNCAACNETTGYCDTCVTGLYGPSCLYRCELCVSGSCGRHNCTNSCIDGYYKDPLVDQCLECSQNCTKCNYQTECLRCMKGFHRHTYNHNNQTFCTKCHDNCEECIGTTDCTVCKPGKYGPECLKNCNISYCWRCDIMNGDICTECATGYKVQNGVCIEGEETCSPFCSDGCYSNGNCFGVCTDGWTGVKCDSTCDDKCKACNQNDASKCTICKGDFYTTNCKLSCGSQCKILPNMTKCDLLSGMCLKGCDTGYWGDYCEQTCSEGCKSNLCEQSHGYCNVCQRNFYGPDCQNKCSSNCFDNDSAEHICNKTDGKCIRGCVVGYSGAICGDVHTISVSPSTLSPKTTSSPTRKTDTVVKQKDDGYIAPIAAGAVGGLILLVVLAVGIMCFIRRKKKKGEPETSERESPTIDEEHHALDDLDNVYAKPNKKPRKEPVQDYIYAQPIKLKKSTHHNKDEISKPLKAYDNVVVDLETVNETNDDDTDEHVAAEEAVGMETDLYAEMLEDIDDELENMHVTGVTIPASDTYYNMASLKRSRIQVSKLLEYIQNKTDFDHEFEKLPKGLTRTCDEALKPQNRAKNRYNGIYAYNATRVKLNSKDFINANYVEGQCQSGVSYIASLGPTRRTMDNFETFWEMVWQENSNKIVMLTNLEEAETMKCEQYWPNQGININYGGYTVSCVAEKIFSDFVVRELTVDKGSETRTITQFHYTAWPDKTVPLTVASLIEFRDKVEHDQIPMKGPMIVHCSAGIGRTGTYIALDKLIREGKEEHMVDIFGCVIGLRGQRVNMVQNVEQYIFLHHCVLYVLTCEPGPLPVTSVPRVFTDEKITTQFQSLQNMTLLSNKHKRLKSHMKHKKENRKGADIPDDEHRVILTSTKHDYINAVFSNGYQEEDKFIFAQTPLPNTVKEFIAMVYQERCSCIVCLDEENITDKTVAQYIPPANKVATFGHFQVSNTKSESKKDFIIRELKISQIRSPPAKDLKVVYYQFKGWKSSEIVPEDVSSFLNTIADVEKTRKLSKLERPILVHCLTGAERSGLFCVVSVLMEKMGVEKSLSVLNTVCQVRARRKSAIQEMEQLQFCYRCVKDMLEMSGKSPYYNVTNIR